MPRHSLNSCVITPLDHLLEHGVRVMNSMRKDDRQAVQQRPKEYGASWGE